MDDEAAQLWAVIFNEFGQENLREILFDSLREIERDEGGQRRVVEFINGERGPKAIDITDHVNQLEDSIDRP